MLILYNASLFKIALMKLKNVTENGMNNAGDKIKTPAYLAVELTEEEHACVDRIVEGQFPGSLELHNKTLFRKWIEGGLRMSKFNRGYYWQLVTGNR